MASSQAKKLKKLTVVTLCSQSKALPYETLMRELEVRSSSALPACCSAFSAPVQMCCERVAGEQRSAGGGPAD